MSSAATPKKKSVATGFLLKKSTIWLIPKVIESALNFCFSSTSSWTGQSQSMDFGFFWCFSVIVLCSQESCGANPAMAPSDSQCLLGHQWWHAPHLRKQVGWQCPVKTPTRLLRPQFTSTTLLGHQNPIFQSVPFCRNKICVNIYLSIYSCYFSGSFQTLKYSTTFSLSETCASAIQTKPRCHQYRWHKRPRATYVVAPWHCASPPQWLLQSLKTVMLWSRCGGWFFVAWKHAFFLGELFEWRNTTNKEFGFDFRRS